MERLINLIRASLSLTSSAPQGGPQSGAMRDALVRELPEPTRLDPLIAEQAALALERLGAVDATLIRQLRARATGGSRASARVPALTVDRAGVGVTCELTLDLCPGSQGAWTLQEHAVDSQHAALMAVNAALRGESGHWSCRWQVEARDGSLVALEGMSIGLAAAAATRCARERRVISGWGLTGRVDPDGRVRGVHALKAKLSAASEAGLRGVVAPREDIGRLLGPPVAPDLELVGVDNLEELWAWLDRVAPAPPPEPPPEPPAPPPRRGWLVAGLAALVLLAAAWVTSSLPHTTQTNKTIQPSLQDPTTLQVCLETQSGLADLREPQPMGSSLTLALQASRDGVAWLYARSQQGRWVRLSPVRGDSATVVAGQRARLPPTNPTVLGAETAGDRMALVWSPGAGGDPDPLVNGIATPSAALLEAALPGAARWHRQTYAKDRPCLHATIAASDAAMLEIPIDVERP